MLFGMKSEEFLALQKEGISRLSGVVLVHGEEEFLKELVADAIRDSLDPSVDVRRYAYDEVELADVLGEVSSGGLFEQRRVVIVERAERLFSSSLSDDVLEEFERIASRGNLLVILCSKLSSKNKLYRLIARSGTVVECAKLPQRQLPGWIMRRCRQKHDKSIDGLACTLLAELCGSNLSVVERCLESLASYTGERKRITRSDVEELVADSRQKSIFEFFDALIGGNRARAMELIFELYGSGMVLPHLIAFLHRQFEKYWKAKLMLQREVSSEELQEELGLPAFVARRLERTLAFVPFSYLARAISVLRNSDYVLKTSEVPERVILTELCARLVNEGSPVRSR